MRMWAFFMSNVAMRFCIPVCPFVLSYLTRLHLSDNSSVAKKEADVNDVFFRSIFIAFQSEYVYIRIKLIGGKDNV